MKMKPYSFKLHPVNDADLIGFLDDKPKTWIVKTALREYVAKFEAMEQPVSRKVSASMLEDLE